MLFSRIRRRHKQSATPRLVASMLLLAAALLPAQQDPSFLIDVKLVSLFVNVTDGKGALIGGLGRENFAIREDGRPQQIAVFERQSAQPLNIVLAIDTSGSVRKDMSQETAAARRFVRSLLRPQDQMSVFEFSTEVRELAGFTNKPAEIDHALGKLRGSYTTALYDMIRLGAERLGTRQGRKVLVLVSDGGDTAQSSTYAQALEAALHNEAMIYSLIDVPIAASAGRNTGGEHALITLSEQTGGGHFYVGAGGLDQAFNAVGEALRSQYLLGYYPRHQEPGQSFHRLEVSVPRAAVGQFNVRHKTGYYATAENPEE